MEFAGKFELHLTVQLASLAGLNDLSAWAACNGLKCLHIVLERGQTVSQPMLSQRGVGTLSHELSLARNLVRRLSADGFLVTRVKIEASVENDDVPHADALDIGVGRYFEHHVKLLLDDITDLSAIVAIAQRRSAHVSRNALRIRSDGKHERFLTQRCGRVGSISAKDQLDKLLGDLRILNHVILSVEREYVVYDSNCEIDQGWIDQEG